MSTITQLGCAPSNSLPALQTSPADFMVFAAHDVQIPGSSICEAERREISSAQGCHGLLAHSLTQPRPHARRRSGHTRPGFVLSPAAQGSVVKTKTGSCSLDI